MLNIANALKKHNLHDDAVEAEILLGLSLINARRFLQATEIFRKISDFFVKKHEESKWEYVLWKLVKYKIIMLNSKSTISK